MIHIARNGSDVKSALPSGWQSVQFNEAITRITPQTRKLKTSEYLKSGLYPVVDQGQDEIAGYTNDQSCVIDHPLPLIIFGDHTKVAKHVNYPFAIGADGVVLLSANNNADSKFLFYWLRQVDIRNLGYARHFGVLRNESIPLPALAEQKRIAAVLNEQMAAVDRARAAAQTQLAGAKALATAYLRDVFCGPEALSWPVVTLGEISSLIVDGPHVTPDYVHEGVPFLTVRNIVNREIDFTNVSYVSYGDHLEFCRRGKAQRADILYTKDGTLGIPCLVATDTEFSFFVSVALIKLKKDRSYPAYVVRVLESPQVAEQVKSLGAGAGLKHMVLKSIRALKIPLPLFEVQKGVATILNEQVAAVEVLQTALEVQLNEINALPASLLRRAFAGEL